MRILLVLFLILTFFSCQKNPVVKQVSDVKPYRVNKTELKTNDSIIEDKGKATIRKYAVVYNDYSSIISSLVKDADKSKYYQTEYIDTAVLLCPKLLDKLSISCTTLYKDLGINVNDYRNVLLAHQKDAISRRIKYNVLFDLLNDHLYFKLVFENMFEDRFEPDQELYVTFADDKYATFTLNSGNWSTGYLIVLDGNTLKMKKVSYTEEMPDLVE